MIVDLSEAGVEAAVATLLLGSAVAIPTDTVYGIVACASSASACESIFRIKQRSHERALPVLVSDSEQAWRIGDPTGAAKEFACSHWPGKLTIVVDRRRDVDIYVGGSDDTVGLRVPNHPVARQILRAVGPLAATSANLHGMPPAIDAEGVVEIFGEALSIVVASGTLSPDGSASTVVGCRSTDSAPTMIRRGSVVPECFNVL